MSNLLLHGFNKADGTDKIMGCISGILKLYNSSTGMWNTVTTLSLNASNDVAAVNFLDQAIFTNYLTNFTYNGTTWSTATNTGDMPLGKYLETHTVRVFVGNIKIRGTAYPSRVAFTDLPKNGGLVWGFETGTDLAQSASSAVVTSAGSTFITRGIKVGDTLIIESGTNAGEYIVKSVDSQTQLTLTTTLTNATTGSSFWVSSNWFDVMTDDGDILTGFGKNSNDLLVFKRNSLHRYNVNSKTLRQVKNVKGTTSPKSIINANEYTYYFYPKLGILRYDGTTSLSISNGIKDIIDGIDTSMYTSVVGWSVDDKKIEFYIGDVTLRDGGTISKCAITYSLVTESWSTRSLPWAIEQRTMWYSSGVPNTYILNSVGQALKVDDGYTYSGESIAFQLEDKVLFPAGPDTLVDFKRLMLFVEDGEDLQVLYKLYYKPTLNNNRWVNDTDWQPVKIKGNGEKLEITFPSGCRAGGIKLKFIQSSSREGFLLERYVLYYSNPAAI
jgi:hypothetical protein